MTITNPTRNQSEWPRERRYAAQARTIAEAGPMLNFGILTNLARPIRHSGDLGRTMMPNYSYAAVFLRGGYPGEAPLDLSMRIDRPVPWRRGIYG